MKAKKSRFKAVRDSRDRFWIWIPEVAECRQAMAAFILRIDYGIPIRIYNREGRRLITKYAELIDSKELNEEIAKAPAFLDN